MQGKVAFLMKDAVLLAVSFSLLKQDLVRLPMAAAPRRELGEVGQTRAGAIEEVAAR
jgi:hypothetical protein